MMDLVRSCEIIFVRSKNGSEEILLSKRGAARHGAGTWAVPGGHIGDSPEIADESVAEAVEREVREELGDALGDAFATALTQNDYSVCVVDDLRPTAQPPVHYFHTSFIVKIPNTVEAVNMEPTQCAQLCWFTKTNLPLAEFYPPHMALIKNYLAGRQYASVTGLK